MKVQQIFTPNDTPTITYVDRTEHKLEQRLREYYETPNIVISVSGPSKSGKTVLIKKVIPEDLLIPVLGAGIASAENLWERVINWMGGPTETTITESVGTELGGTVGGGGKVKIPLIAEGEMSGSASAGQNWGKATSVTTKHDSLTQVIKEISGSDFVVFIDDFHYIRSEFRDEIGRQLKAAAENGVKIVTASVPHRSDDVVRSNPELRGRVAAVDLAYWAEDELRQIAAKGFNALNFVLNTTTEKRLAAEAFGSPQLMQAICLNLCYELQIRETNLDQIGLSVSDDQFKDTLLRSSSFTDFTKMVTALHTGPRTRGTERKLHDFVDGTQGDVYRAILLALKSDPAELSLPYDSVLSRVKAVCSSDSPVGSSITSALEQMQLIGEEVQPGTNPLYWDSDTFVVSDPYFLFYLRNSDKLSELGSAKKA